MNGADNYGLEDALKYWVWPDGPFGWNEDGTSKAFSSKFRKLHVDWYHTKKEQVEQERIQNGGCMYCDMEATTVDQYDYPCCSECNAPTDE